jgi:hypothetical protein
VLGDIMTDDTYRDDDEKEEKKEKKDEKKDEKKKSVAFKATSSKGKAKQDTSSEDDGSWDDDDEKMALFVKKFGKFMTKKGYHARRKKSSSKNKEVSRRCFKCGSKDHLVAQCPYNSDNDDDNKKNKKKDKKEKKEKKDKMTFKKKKGGSYVVTWESDASSSDDCQQNMVGSLPRGMPKVVDCRQIDAQATNKMVTQDRHEVLSRFGHQEGVIPTSCV